MQVKLLDLSGGSRRKPVCVDASPFTIGRAPTCNLRLATDFVSRVHCQITVEGQSVFVQDYGSRNGTIVNGVAIPAVSELRDGDVLTLGATKLQVCIDNEPRSVHRAMLESLAARDASGIQTGIYMATESSESGLRA